MAYEDLAAQMAGLKRQNQFGQSMMQGSMRPSGPATSHGQGAVKALNRLAQAYFGNKMAQGSEQQMGDMMAQRKAGRTQSLMDAMGGPEVDINALLQSGDPELEGMGVEARMAKPPKVAPKKMRVGRAGGMVADVYVDPLTNEVLMEGEPYFPSSGMADFAPVIGGGERHSDRSKRIADQRKKGEKKASDATAKLIKSQKMGVDLDEFLALNETVDTGLRYATNLQQETAARIYPDVARMKSIQDLLTPQMRQGMPGAASDRDVAMFRGATVGLSKPKEANQMVVRAFKRGQDILKDRSAFLNWHVEKFGQAGPGAETKWSEYLESNPIFDPSKPSTDYSLNPSRIEWSSWFKEGSREAQSVVEPLNADEQAELEQLRRELGQ